ncbi:diguanylate cyclase (GGDEF) domain-containing protein [Aquisalimonas asiatica]|uniref:Diguanylate cyclase (GGDEF) domain-containing protein n=1 Tax=Aquisalimonas asiatica TaxID=406100 RepID=A0A1H8SJP1_9GAMM|nr:diguanylate cyclase (GGDEF) domain-containing protein [Aquisalimonas asiatica]
MAGVVGAVLGAGALAVDRVASERAQEEARNAVLTEAGNLRARLEGELNATIFMVKGLARFAGANPDLSWHDFAAMAERMVTGESHVRNVGLAPGDVVSYMYPLAGNQEALGLDIAEHPEQRRSLDRMKAEGRAVVAGPMTLAQGDEALIVRAPVTLNDGSYWGAATVPVSHESLLESAGLLPLEGRALNVALRGRDGTGSEGEVFFGSEEVFRADPVLLDISFQNDAWQLAAVPAAGWAAYSALPYWARLTGAFLVLATSAVAGVLTYQAQRLRHVTRRLEAMIAAVPDIGFVIDDQGRYLEAFGGRERQLYHDGSGLVGHSFDDIMDEAAARHFRGAVRRAIDSGQLVTLEHPVNVEDLPQLGRRDGPSGKQWFQARIFPLPEGLERRPCVLWLAYNITDQYQARQAAREQEERIRHLALHDHLTGLANRTLFLDRLGHAIARAEREEYRLALLFIDLDRFKPVNDAHGHHVGDSVLQEIARRLQDTVRSLDTVVRHGGDEFVVLLPRIDTEADAGNAAARILDALKRPLLIEGLELRIGGSIGIGLYPDHGTDADALQHVADDAMYDAKAAGGSTYRFAGGAMVTTPSGP